MFISISPEQSLWENITLFIELGKLKPVISWCEDHCIGDYRFTNELRDALPAEYYEMFGSYYRFWFEDPQDLTTFVLKWM